MAADLPTSASSTGFTFSLGQLFVWTGGIAVALAVDTALAGWCFPDPLLAPEAPVRTALAALLLFVAATYHGIALVGLASAARHSPFNDLTHAPGRLVLAWCGVDTLVQWLLAAALGVLLHADAFEAALLLVFLYGLMRFAGLLWLRVQIAEPDAFTRATEWVGIGGAALVGFRMFGTAFAVLVVFALPLLLLAGQTHADLHRARAPNADHWAGVAAIYFQCAAVLLIVALTALSVLG